MNTHTITIYGPGCMRCTTLEENARKAVQDMPGDYRITKISHPMQIADAGVFNTPALSLDGALLTEGRVLTSAQIRELLQKNIQGGCSCRCSVATASPDIESEPLQPCHGAQKNKRSGWKTALLIGAAGLLSMAGIKQWQTASESRQDTNVATADGNYEELIYYTFGKRCPTCLRMEAWAGTVAEQHQIPFRVQEADAGVVEQYGLTTKFLILRQIKGGKEATRKKLERIWELSRDEAAFKHYVSEQIDSYTES